MLTLLYAYFCKKETFLLPISPALFLFPIIITKHITGWDWSDPVWPPPRQQGEQQQQQQPHHPPQRPPRQHQRQELVGSVSLYFIFSWDCLFILYILAGLSLYALYSRRAVPLYFIFQSFLSLYIFSRDCLFICSTYRHKPPSHTLVILPSKTHVH